MMMKREFMLKPNESIRSANTNTVSADESTPSRPRRRRLSSRLMVLARRTHLYAGLFLLPWVFLYGITGAMYNHQSLLPRATIQNVPTAVVDASELPTFPTPDQLAARVVAAIDAAADDVDVAIAQRPGAEYTNDVMFKVIVDNHEHIVHLDPIAHQAEIFKFPPQDFRPERLIHDVKNVGLTPNPLSIARQSAEHIFKQSGVVTDDTPQQFGWTKLNFIATVDGQPARITYVLNDGHVDVMKYDGHHGMATRGFFLRLHTSHGQPPHWNGRMVWSLFVDAMAIAMVSWGLTGLLMWWQIKRTRLIGGLVISASIATATIMYLTMQEFYASTVL